MSIDLQIILKSLLFLLEFWELGAWIISISWFVWLLDLCLISLYNRDETSHYQIPALSSTDSLYRYEVNFSSIIFLKFWYLPFLYDYFYWPNSHVWSCTKYQSLRKIMMILLDLCHLRFCHLVHTSSSDTIYS